MKQIKIEVDGWILAGVWLGVLGTLAYDVAFSDLRTLIVPGMVWFLIIAIIGVAWRRYWKGQRIEADRKIMRQIARNVDGVQDGEQ